ANSRRPWPAAPVLRASNRSVAASKSSRSAIAAAMANLHPFAMLNQITSDSGTPSVSLAHRDLVLAPDCVGRRRLAQQRPSLGRLMFGSHRPLRAIARAPMSED